MKDSSSFREPTEELQHLREEMAEIKSLLRTIASRITQIERHTKRAFGIVALASDQNSTRISGSQSSATAAPTINPTEALSIYDDLTEIWRVQGGRAVEVRLEKMSVADLKLMAHELGVTFSTKPSRKVLQARIVGRINESVMLSKNSNVTQPRSAESHHPPNLD